MSTDQPDLSTFVDDTPERLTAADWDPGHERQEARRCLGCGAQVTPSFQRSHGDSQDRLWGCLECLNTQVSPAVFADPERARRARASLSGGEADG